MAIKFDPNEYLLQGSGANLQGGGGNLQGGGIVLQGSSPVLQAQPVAPAPAPKPAPVRRASPTPAVAPVLPTWKWEDDATVFRADNNQALSEQQFLEQGGQWGQIEVRKRPTAQPAALPVDPNQSFSQTAGASGVGVDDYLKLIGIGAGVTPDERAGIRSDLGLDTLEKSVFTPPAKTTEQMYQDAFAATGLSDIKKQFEAKQTEINAKKQQLTERLAKIDENPWKVEATRLGAVAREKQYYEDSIGNLVAEAKQYADLYNQGLEEVNAFVSRTSGDFSANQELNLAKLQYLEAKAEQQAKDLEASKGSKLYRYFPDYLTGKAAYEGTKNAEKMPSSYIEYQLASQDPNYNNYLTADANRKRSVANTIIGNSGMDSKQIATFNGIVAKYNASPLVQAADRTVILQNSIEGIKADPSNGAKQLNLSYSYIQALDTYQSAVREGELTNINTIDSKIGQLQGSIEKIQKGQIVRPEVALQIADAAGQLISTIKQAANSKAQSFGAQAKVSGIGEAWDSYIGSFTPSYQSGTGAGGAAADLSDLNFTF